MLAIFSPNGNLLGCQREVGSSDCLSTLPYVPLQLKESKRAVNSLRDFVDDEDDDDLERVSWSGEPVGSK